jgi:hypothetical protein
MKLILILYLLRKKKIKTMGKTYRKNKDDYLEDERFSKKKSIRKKFTQENEYKEKRKLKNKQRELYETIENA